MTRHHRPYYHRKVSGLAAVTLLSLGLLLHFFGELETALALEKSYNSLPPGSSTLGGTTSLHEVIGKGVGAIHTINSSGPCRNCSVPPPQYAGDTAPLSDSCADFYDKIYSQGKGRDGKIEFVIAIGFLENDDGQVSDHYIANNIELNAQLACSTGKNYFCGFTAPEEGLGDVFEKDVYVPKFGQQRVKLNIVHSSIQKPGSFLPDLTNQAQRTQDAESAFYEQGVSSAPVIIYVGHGRNGCGPSFEPLSVLAGRIGLSGKNVLTQLLGEARKCEPYEECVDASRKATIEDAKDSCGVKRSRCQCKDRLKLFETLYDRKTKPAFVSFTNCNGPERFESLLASATKKKTGLHLHPGTNFSNDGAVERVSGILETLLSGACGDEFVKGVNQGQGMGPYPGELTGEYPRSEGKRSPSSNSSTLLRHRLPASWSHRPQRLYTPIGDEDRSRK